MKKSDLILSFLILGLACFFFSPLFLKGPQNDIWFFVVIGLLFLFGALSHVVFVFKARILADENGITTVGLFKQKSLRWTDIISYREKTNGKSPKKLLVLQGISKSIVINPNSVSWTCMEDLINLIPLKAQKADTTNWLSRGGQLKDGVKHSFDYSSSENMMALWLFSIGSLFCVYYFGSSTLSKLTHPPNYFRYLSLGMKLAMFATVVCVSLMYPLLLGLILIPRFIDYRNRRFQQIEVTNSSITIIDRGRRMEVKWQDVTSFESQSRKKLYYGRVYAAQSDSSKVEFTSSIGQLQLLVDLINTHLSDKQLDLAKKCDEDLLGGERSLWTGGFPGAGDRVYHYRTRTTRALLCLFGFFPLMFLSREYAGRMGWLPGSVDSSPFVIGCPLMFAFVYMFISYRSTRIILTQSGIEYHSLIRITRIDWSEIKCFRKRGQDALQHYVIEGAGKRIMVWGTLAAFTDLVQQQNDKALNCKFPKDS